MNSKESPHNHSVLIEMHLPCFILKYQFPNPVSMFQTTINLLLMKVSESWKIKSS